MSVLRLIIAAILVSGMVLTLGGAPKTALAGEVVVGSPGYACDQGGLASAINAAATDDPDNPGVVTFDCAGTINFSSQITFGSGGPLPARAVIIDGSNGGNQIVFDGGNSTSFFHVRFRGYLTLKHVTMQNGHTSERGGAINNDSGNLTVIQSSFTGNYAQYEGGAIRNTATANISQSTFTNNSAGSGGAIYGYPGTVTIDRSVFESNTATYNGGAIGNAGKMTITESTFEKNSANGTFGAGGGAIYSSENVGRLTVERSTFTENKALNTLAYGGAISSNNAQLTVKESRFDNNEATGAGAIYQGSSNTTVVSRSTFVNNKAQDNGGGAVVSRGGSLSVVASSFTGNTSTAMGSVIRVSSFSGPTRFAWSTIIQPEGTGQALYLDENLTLEGVILGGPGSHCLFDGGSLTDSYTLANDTSCGLSGVASQQVAFDDGLTEFGLGQTTSAMVNEVLQSYHPLLTSGPALNGGPEPCEIDADLDQLGNVRPYPTDGPCTVGAIEVNNLPPVVRMTSQLPLEINEGGTIGIEFGDPNISDLFNYLLDCDESDEQTDGSGSDNTPIVLRCTYLDDGQFTGTATASDDSATSTQTFSVTVKNIAPVMSGIGIAGPPLMSTNQPVNVLLFAVDVPADQITFMLSCDSTSAPIAVGPISSITNVFSGVGSCSYATSGFYTVSVYAVDDDGGVSGVMTSNQTLHVVEPTMLCAQRSNGALRVSDTCSRSETQIVLPQDGAQTLCVNKWNGTASLGGNCSRSEYSISVNGDQSVEACVNTWNGSLRVGGNCSRSERQVGL